MVSKSKNHTHHNYEGITNHAAWSKSSSLMHDESQEVTKRNKNAAIIAVGFWIADMCKKLNTHHVI